MTSIFKVAKMFQQKLIFASTSNFNNLKAVYQAAQMVTNLKPLWLSGAGNDPYSEVEIEQKLSKVRNVAATGYGQAMNYGMPASGPNSYAGFLTNMAAAVDDLSNWTSNGPLDPSASNSLGRLRSAVDTAQSQFTPVGIPAQQPTQVLPTTTIVGDPQPATELGAAYTESVPEGADPEKLKGVVDKLMDKKPEWTGFFEPTE